MLQVGHLSVMQHTMVVEKISVTLPTMTTARPKKILGRSLLNSELGCYLSHYGCVEKFLQTDADYLVVLEDDLRIDNNFSSTLQEILHYLHSQKNIEWSLINIAAKKK